MPCFVTWAPWTQGVMDQIKKKFKLGCGARSFSEWYNASVYLCICLFVIAWNGKFPMGEFETGWSYIFDMP